MLGVGPERPPNSNRVNFKIRKEFWGHSLVKQTFGNRIQQIFDFSWRHDFNIKLYITIKSLRSFLYHHFRFTTKGGWYTYITILIDTYDGERRLLPFFSDQNGWRRKRPKSIIEWDGPTTTYDCMGDGWYQVLIHCDM